ncbi:MAG: MlaD family protein [Candidatus Cloacimonadaceae bacterium]|jgi:phospholipid/cholesterol/gamma-HCH transport system substrate-binding protein
MLSKAQKVRLGAFITVGSILLLAILIAIAGNRLMDRKDTYYISFENYSVQGLQVGGAVNFRGIKVGSVEAIKIDPKNVNKVIVTIKIDRGTPIKEDATAILIFVGITGVKAVEISPGTNESALLKPKSFIKTGSSMIDDISDRALSITEKIDQIAANINQMTDEENRRNIAEILRQTSMLLSDTRENLGSTMVSLNKVANSVAVLTDDLNVTMVRITDTFVDNVNMISENAATSITSVSDNANQMMNRLSDDVAEKLDVLTSSTTTLIDSLNVTSTRGLNELITNLNEELDRLATTLDSSLTEINTNTNALLVDTRRQINQVGDNSNELILMSTREIALLSAEVNKSINRVNQLLASDDFEGIVTNLNSISAKLTEVNMKDLVSELVVTLNKTSAAIGNIDRMILRNRANINETMESLREATANLNEFSRQIAEQPSIIIRGN